jgi:hypothetical protein
MDEWTIYPSINNLKRSALGSPDGRELRRGEAVEILLQQRETKKGGPALPPLHECKGSPRRLVL